jgi:hypothetical protein
VTAIQQSACGLRQIQQSASRPATAIVSARTQTLAKRRHFSAQVSQHAAGVTTLLNSGAPVLLAATAPPGVIVPLADVNGREREPFFVALRLIFQN